MICGSNIASRELNFARLVKFVAREARSKRQTLVCNGKGCGKTEIIGNNETPWEIQWGTVCRSSSECCGDGRDSFGWLPLPNGDLTPPLVPVCVGWIGVLTIDVFELFSAGEMGWFHFNVLPSLGMSRQAVWTTNLKKNNDRWCKGVHPDCKPFLQQPTISSTMAFPYKKILLIGATSGKQWSRHASMPPLERRDDEQVSFHG